MEHKELKISELLVNTENPRFDPVSNQSEAIELMLEKHGTEIKKLAEDIATYGLNPSKRLIVICHGSKYIPLEGNRRTVALLLLDNPKKTTKHIYRDYFQKLKNQNQKQIPQTISSVVFNDKAVA